MPKYKKVLLAVDFFEDNEQIIDKAVQIAADNDATLMLVHVNEPVISAYPADGLGGWGPQMTEMQSELRTQSRKKLGELAQKLNVETDNIFLRDGKAASEIRTVADDNDVDLIVLGTHGQHGFQLLLGSTANSVLHGVSCDVLSVRVHQQ